MEDNNKLKLEREELNRLINKGISFEVMDVEFRKRTRLLGLKKEVYPVDVMRQFKIEEPTLGTLDRLSAEWVQMAIDEEALQGKDSLNVAKAMTKDNAMRCAKIVAIAVLGSNYLIPLPDKSGNIHYVEDNDRLEYLTGLFARQIKPSQLYQLCVAINAMCNLGDFLNSIRLMCAERTTGRIEENNED